MTKNRQLERLAVSQINDKLTKSEFGVVGQTLWKCVVYFGNTAQARLEKLLVSRREKPLLFSLKGVILDKRAKE